MNWLNNNLNSGPDLDPCLSLLLFVRDQNGARHLWREGERCDRRKRTNWRRCALTQLAGAQFDMQVFVDTVSRRLVFEQLEREESHRNEVNPFAPAPFITAFEQARASFALCALSLPPPPADAHQCATSPRLHAQALRSVDSLGTATDTRLAEVTKSMQSAEADYRTCLLVRRRL